MSIELAYPFTSAKVRALSIGDRVTLSGKIFTARDRMHKFLAEGGKCPVDLKDGAIYHCGPVVIRKDGQWVVRAAGPTTSSREDPYMPRIIEQYRVRLILGKGGMGEVTRRICSKLGCAYVQMLGGAAALLAESIRRVENVHFLKEFGPTDALWELHVEGLSGIVTMDTRGRSLHKRIKTSSKRVLRRIVQ